MTSPEQDSYEIRKEVIQDTIDRLNEPGYLERLKELNKEFEIEMKELNGMRYFEKTQLKKVG